MPRQKNKIPSVYLPVMLPAPMAGAVKALAKEMNMTPSAFVRQALNALIGMMIRSRKART